MKPKHLSCLLLGAACLLCGAAKQPMTFSDLMKFREIEHLSLSLDSSWLSLTAQPDRGPGDVLAIRCSDGHTITLKQHEEPSVSSRTGWLIAYQAKDPNLYPAPEEEPPTGRSLTLVKLTDNHQEHFEQVLSAGFDSSGEWLFIRHIPKDPKQSEPSSRSKKDKNGEEETLEKEEKAVVLLIHLPSRKRTSHHGIVAAAMDPDSPRLALSSRSRLTLLELTGETPKARILLDLPEREVGQATWSEKMSWMAVPVSLYKKTEPAEAPRHTVYVWHPTLDACREIPLEKLPEDWIIPPGSPLRWDRNGDRLSIGTRPGAEYRFFNPVPISRPQGAVPTTPPYKELLADRSVEVWHWRDPQIKSQEKAQRKKLTEQTYTAVYLARKHQLLQLGGPELRRISLIDDCPFALGFDRRPYSLEATWDNRYEDVYLVNTNTGARELILRRNEQPVSLSPDGGYLAYFRDSHWYLYDRQKKTCKNLTASLPCSFADEDHDTPDPPPPYGLAGWLAHDRALFLYDRYDIWRHNPVSGKTSCITTGSGRSEKTQFRRQRIERHEPAITPDKDWLLTAFSEKGKWTRFYRGKASSHRPKPLSDGEYSYRFITSDVGGKTLLFSRERLEVFPDIWMSDADFSAPRQLTQINPQIKRFNWGRSELMHWKSADGIDLEGVVIKPEDFQPGKKYPVIVYFYELSADRLLRYNPTVINHRPCFPLYAGNGYILFLPDIRFQIGRPGFSAVKCLVPGVLKLIDLGVADPKAIALHGHSWSGYQTAFAITQTDLFACALAGAPVSNMTSAYNGIRWGEGIARQFQYEKSQSRIGPNLFSAPHLYFENSPVFFAERINTPLLIEHGDEDEAVPWYQSIELYLAMRRLNKACVFLQYHREPHHLKQYANRLDYSIKMKEFFDHFLKGAPAPEWWRQPSSTVIRPPYKEKEIELLSNIRTDWWSSSTSN